MEEINLLNGEIINLVEESISGMAGEPMTVLMIYKDEKPCKLYLIEHLLGPRDLKMIQDWRNSLDENNHQSAINWVI